MPEAGPEPKPKLTKGLRRMIVYGGMLAFGAIGLSVLVRLPVFNTWLAGFLAGQLEASLGEDVVLEDVEISLVPFEFRAAGLTVSHEGRVALKADAVRVDFDLYGLGGINTLHVESPVAELHIEDGKLIEFPGLSWGAEAVDALPWDTLSISGGEVAVSVDGDGEKMGWELSGIELTPTSHATGDLRIGRLSVKRGDFTQEAEEVRARGFALSVDRLGADSLLLETDLLRVEGGAAVEGTDRAWSGDLLVALDLDELAPLLPPDTTLEGQVEAALSLDGFGEHVTAFGPMRSSILLRREKHRVHVTHFPELTGDLRVSAESLSLQNGETTWGGGPLNVVGESRLDGTGVQLSLKSQAFSLEEVLRSDAGFPKPWVGMEGAAQADLRGSFSPFQLEGPLRVVGRNLMVVNKGLHTGREPTLVLDSALVEGDITLDSWGTRLAASRVSAPASQGTAVISLARGPFPEFDLKMDWRELDYALLAPLGNVRLGGTGTLNGRIWGNLGRPLQAKGTAKASDFEVLGLPWADRIEARFQSPDLRHLSFDPLVAWKGKSVLKGAMDLHFKPDDLQMQLGLEMEDSRVEDLLAVVLDSSGLTGGTAGHIQLSGPPKALNGRLDLELAMVDLWGEHFTEGRLVGRVESGRIVLDPLRLSRQEAQESIWFRGAIESSDWALTGELGADRVGLRAERTAGWVRGDLYANIGLSGTIMSPIPKGRIALRDGFLLQEEVGTSLFEFHRVDDELVWTADLFEEALSVRARQQIGGLWRFSLEGGWRDFPVHALRSTAADGRPLLAQLDGSYLLQGNWREGRESLHGRATAERFEFRWGDQYLKNSSGWIIDVMSGNLVMDRLDLQGSGMHAQGSVYWDQEGLRSEGGGLLMLGLLPAFAPGIELAEGPVNLQWAVNTQNPGPATRLEMVAAGGYLRSEWFPHTLENFTARLLFTEDGYAVNSLSGQLGGGRFAASGHIHAEAWRPTRYDLQAELDDGRIRYLRFLPTMSGDARMALEGPLESLALTGDILLEDVRFTERIDWEQWVIDLRESKLSEEVETSDSDPLFALNLSVTGSGAGRIRNNLAHGQVDVDLQVVGDTDRPGVLGSVRMQPGGRMFLQDREFDVARAEMHYEDPWSFDPELDILLNTDIRSREETYRIDYQVGGPFSSWYTQASSQPALSQADINALLLFGLTREELERFGGGNAALLMEGADLLLHGVGLDDRALDRLGGGGLPFDRVELVTGVSERGNQVNSGTRVLLEKQISDPYNVDIRVEFNPFRNVENIVEVEKQVGDSMYLTVYRSSLEQERSIEIGGAYGLDFKLRWEVE